MAGLALSVLHLPALQWDAVVPGRCTNNIESSTGAAEMTALYVEVFQAASASPAAYVSDGQLLQQ